MVKYGYLSFYFIYFISYNLINATEVEYYWSGAVTPESAVISFATDEKARVKIQYSESENFKKDRRYTKTCLLYTSPSPRD